MMPPPPPPAALKAALRFSGVDGDVSQRSLLCNKPVNSPGARISLPEFYVQVAHRDQERVVDAAAHFAGSDGPVALGRVAVVSAVRHQERFGLRRVVES